jgi:dihydrofolate reductase
MASKESPNAWTVFRERQLGQTLLEHDLVDVLDVWVHPVILGTGEALFRPGPRENLRLHAVDQRSTA